MTSWAKKLAEHGESKRKPKAGARSCDAQPRKPAPIVQATYAQVRPSSDNDPGEVTPVFYIVDDGVLLVTDSTGKPIEKIKPHAQTLAKLMTLALRREADPGNFNRRLDFPRRGIA